MNKVLSVINVVVLLFLIGVPQVLAQDRVVTWREQITQVLEIVLDIQSGVRNLTDNAVSSHEVQALETRVKMLEQAIAPPVTPTVTPYQKIRDQEEQSLHRELVLFLYQQDIAIFEDDVQFMDAEDYVDDIVNTVVILAGLCEVSVYEIVKLIDLEAKRIEAERSNAAAYKNGKPYMTRQYVPRWWIFAETKEFCQGE